MKTLFNYFFYRIALFYKKHIPFEDYLGQGVFLQLFSIFLNILTILDLFLINYGLKLTKKVAIIFLIPFALLTVFIHRLFPNREQLFNDLSIKYLYEKMRWIKGLFVFLYILISLVAFFLVILVL